MSRTLIPTKRVTVAGLAFVTADYVAGDTANGNYCANDGATFILFSADATPRTCTITTPVTVGGGLAVADQVESVAASGFTLAGPFPREVFGPQLLLDFSNAALKCLVFSWLPELRA